MSHNTRSDKLGLSEQSLAQFWAQVAKSDGCWLWTGAQRGSGGYGGFGSEYAHRIAYCVGGHQIPPDMEVCHSCDTPLCVRPDHLFLGTHLENVRDAAGKGRLHRQRPGRQRISDEQVALIWPLRAADWTLDAIAAHIGATKGFVSLVLKGKRRQHPKPDSPWFLRKQQAQQAAQADHSQHPQVGVSPAVDGGERQLHQSGVEL